LLANQGSEKPDPSGLKPAEQLEEISRIVHQMVADQYACLMEDLEPKLAGLGAVVRRERERSPALS
jgi:polyphosphate kinase